MQKLPVITFFDYMQQYPHTIPGRIALASELKRVAEYHDELKEINSLADMMTTIPQFIRGGRALASVTGSLWAEYCAVSGHPFLEEGFSNVHNQKRGRKKSLE